jgi:hypothetical protein
MPSFPSSPAPSLVNSSVPSIQTPAIATPTEVINRAPAPAPATPAITQMRALAQTLSQHAFNSSAHVLFQEESNPSNYQTATEVRQALGWHSAAFMRHKAAGDISSMLSNQTHDNQYRERMGLHSAKIREHETHVNSLMLLEFRMGDDSLPNDVLDNPALFNNRRRIANALSEKAFEASGQTPSVETIAEFGDTREALAQHSTAFVLHKEAMGMFTELFHQSGGSQQQYKQQADNHGQATQRHHELAHAIMGIQIRMQNDAQPGLSVQDNTQLDQIRNILFRGLG